MAGTKQNFGLTVNTHGGWLFFADCVVIFEQQLNTPFIYTPFLLVSFL